MPSIGMNVDRLHEAGLIMGDPNDCPTELIRVVEGLTPDEVEVLLAVKRRLDAADEGRGVAPQQSGEHPGFVTCIVF